MVDINEGCDKEKPASSLHREHRFELTEAIIMMYTKPSLTKLIDGFVSQMLQGAIPRSCELVADFQSNAGSSRPLQQNIV